MLPSLTLVLGGARSGKSAYAEALIASTSASSALYIATASPPQDEEMRARIASHQQRRAKFPWRLTEAPLDLVSALSGHANPQEPVLVDCLSLWLANLLEAGRDPAAERARLASALQACPAPVVCVSTEAGLGMVPLHPLGRAFRDHLGALNQQIAALAGRVVFVTAGLPTVLKEQQHG